MALTWLMIDHTHHRRTGLPMLPYRAAGSTQVVLVATVFGILAAGCGERNQPPLPTIDGPEVNDLIPRAPGYVIMDRPKGGLVALAIPDSGEIDLRPESKEQGYVTFITGPDRQGRVVYVEETDVDSMRLRCVRIPDIDDKVIFVRPGDATWHRGISRPELSQRGGLVAFVWNAKPDYVSDIIGPLEIWDVETRRGRETGITAYGQGLSWFPDGRRLAYVELLEGRDLPPQGHDAAGFSPDFGMARGTPVVSVLDLSDGTHERLHVGLNPVVSPDGSMVLLKDAADQWWILNLVTSSMVKAQWPGNWRGPVAWIETDLLLYWGYPTTGSPVRYTRGGSPLVRNHPMGDIKLAELSTGHFQTVIRGIDPRRRLSFGTITDNPVGPSPAPGRGTSGRY